MRPLYTLARFLPAALLLGLLPHALAAQGAGALELLVREAGSGRPLTDASARIVSTGQFILTDPTGHALLLEVPPGRHSVEVRHPGHARQTVEVEFAPGIVTQLQMALQIQPIELEGIEVTAEARVARLQRSGFYHRRRAYPGSFLEPAEVEAARIRGTPLSGLMRGRAGVSVQPVNGGGYTLISSRSIGNQPCPIPIFIDGVRQYAVDNVDRLISAMDVEAIEIYAGRFSTPTQFMVPPYCGAVLIWTPGGR